MFSANSLSHFEKLETPFYYYDLDLLDRTLVNCIEEATKFDFEVHYALKANANNEILKHIVDKGLGADCVSGQEVSKAASSGFDSSKIVFAGVGKSDKEINSALDLAIFCFNVESIQELQVLNQLAKNKNKVAPVALRINPNVNANTHHYITTGLEENKFGINAWELDSILNLLQSLTHIELLGLHFHIGSQITDLDVFKGLCLRVNEFSSWFHERNVALKILNVGGGLGVDYYNPDEHSIPDFGAYFSVFNRFIERRHSQQIHFELGRALVAQCGSLISRVLYVKNGVKTNFVILDAGMTELLRPALYQAYHKIENITKIHRSSNEYYDVVGPICESSDCFGKAVSLPATERGDLIAIRTAGAYGEVMSSRYNLREQNLSIFDKF